MLGGMFRSVLLVLAIVALTYSYVTDKSIKAMVTDMAPSVKTVIDTGTAVAKEVPATVNDAVESTKETIHEATE